MKNGLLAADLKALEPASEALELEFGLDILFHIVMDRNSPRPLISAASLPGCLPLSRKPGVVRKERPTAQKRIVMTRLPRDLRNFIKSAVAMVRVAVLTLGWKLTDSARVKFSSRTTMTSCFSS